MALKLSELRALVAALVTSALVLSACSNASPAASNDSGQPPSDEPTVVTEPISVPPSGDSGDEPTPDGLDDVEDLPSAISCTTQYRPNAASLADAEEHTIAVDREDSILPIGRQVEYTNMTLAVTYTGDAPEGRNVRVAVTASDGSRLIDVLYQLGEPSLSEVRFAGGHGFTGLNYVYQDGASLQFACSAR